MKPKIFSTKKLDPALAAAARQRLDLDEAELISIQTVHDKATAKTIRHWLDTPNLDVAFTSAHAAEAILPLVTKKPLHWRIFSLQGKTKTTLLQPALASLGTIVETAPEAKTLAAQVLHHGIKELLFFCGDRRRDELPHLLRDAGMTVTEVIVYHTVEIRVDVNERYEGLLFFSPSAVHSFFSSNEPPAGTTCFALGATTAAALRPVTENPIITAPLPTQQSLLDTVLNYFDQTPNTHDPVEE